MQIAVIGTGNVGGAIARGLGGKGHSITFGSRNPGSAGAQALTAATGIEVAAAYRAVEDAEIVMLALPWRAAEESVRALGDLASKVVVDCMNPLGMIDGALALTVGHSTSAGEIVQGWLPKARVVKTLNQVGAEIIADNADLPLRPSMLMAGDDESAKRTVASLLTDLGFEAMDAGDITRSRILEPFGFVWINQAMARGKGRHWAFAAVGAPP